jgi:DNA-binding MarR family transcriptional regulator
MMAVFVWMARYYDARFEDLGLTAASARALMQLDPTMPLPTKVLAERLSCDPSNVTPFVDRLEEAGLVERQVDRKDRRVKTLVITAEGRRMRDRMIAIMATDTPPLQSLTAEEQRTLLSLFSKVWAACEGHDAANAPTHSAMP